MCGLQENRSLENANMGLQKKVNKLQVEHVSEEEVDQVRLAAPHPCPPSPSERACRFLVDGPARMGRTRLERPLPAVTSPPLASHHATAAALSPLGRSCSMRWR